MLCQDLKIKVAIIKRLSHLLFEELDFSDADDAVDAVNNIIGTTASTYEIINYVIYNEYAGIARDIANAVPIALELDNLKLNWN